ncbi:hypothetical protein C2G38_2207043 [Gigaspora rosea]|uniref:Uncharacterized protein n=1 Tax=Gigaspora rosea TaxID=44941 RepID=A0A397ULH6_9GLOM|nr:hypothetical protein C2G38_2207043 [Gigaspora rosea]
MILKVKNSSDISQSNQPVALQGTWMKRFTTAATILDISPGGTDWSCVLKRRFENQISSTRRERTFTMYLNEIREQLSEDQRKRSNRKKANLRCYSNEGDIENTATNTIKRQNRLMTCLQVIGILNGEQIASDRDDTIEGYIFHIKRGKIYEVTGRLTKSQPLAFVIKDRIFA